MRIQAGLHWTVALREKVLGFPIPDPVQSVVDEIMAAASWKLGIVAQNFLVQAPSVVSMLFAGVVR